jgi:MFS transporter, PPP family, 3-phenylpropionic acid transporter
MVPYWRLSRFYLFYFATLGALVPYWSLYLQDRGFSVIEIAELMALLMVTKIISPPLWGWLADRSGQRMRVVQLGALLTLITFIFVLVSHGYWQMAAVMFLFSFFWNAILPQFESTTLGYLGTQLHRYSSIRLWGSIGFIVTVATTGPILAEWGADLLPWILMSLFLAIGLSTVGVADCYHHSHDSSTNHLWHLLQARGVPALLVVVFLMQVSHGAYYSFYSIYLEQHGFGREVIGLLWALAVGAEVVLFIYMPKLSHRFSLRSLYLAAMLLAAIRWLVVAWLPNFTTFLTLAQLLHAASFGIMHAVSIMLFHAVFRGRHHGQGQALYSGLSFGGGGAVGIIIAGNVWDIWGGSIAYSFAAFVAVLTAVITLRWLNPVLRAAEKQLANDESKK